jgi:chromosome partitioning protein
LDTISLIRDRLNPRLQVAGIVLTMFDTRNSLSHQVAAEVRKHFGEQVYQTVIPRNVRLSESPSHGVPVTLYDATSKGARAYIDLAAEISGSGESAAGADEGEAIPAAEVVADSAATAEEQAEEVGDGDAPQSIGEGAGGVDHAGNGGTGHDPVVASSGTTRSE